MGKKPPAHVIRSADPLIRGDVDVENALLVCNVCGNASEKLGAFRVHDDYDRPLPGPHALAFIGADHPNCLRLMRRHPRLYAEERGDPGHFPELCGPCRHRDGYGCRHPDLKANGGAGLDVRLSPGLPKNVRICPPPRIVRHALRCAGREVVQ